jgi:hypothetical protein
LTDTPRLLDNPRLEASLARVFDERIGIMSGSLSCRGMRPGLAFALVAAVACSFPVGIAMAEQDDDAGAMFSLQRARRVQERDAVAAGPYRSNLPWPVGATDESRRRWVNATAGPEWDEQAMLLSNALGPPDEIARGSHGAGVWFADIGSELFSSGEFSGGLAGSYWGAAYSDIDFDTHYPTITSWIDWSTGDTTALRVNYTFGYSWVDLDSFATTHQVGPRFYKSWGEGGVTEIRADYYDYDFHLGLPDDPLALMKSDGERKDRSGWGFIASGEHRVGLEFNDTEIRGGYTYQHYIPDGAEFHNQSHELWLGATTALPLGFVLDSNVAFLYRSARNSSSFPDPDTKVYSGDRRRDRIWRVYLAVGRAITPHVSASMEYVFDDHDSSHPSYDFDRHRIGGYVTVHFD